MAGNKEQIASHVFVDLGIAQYLHLPHEEQVQMWKNRSFLEGFPTLAKRLLSQEGLLQFSETDRRKIFTAGAEALSTFSWHESYDSQNAIPLNGRRYDLFITTPDGHTEHKNEARTRFILGNMFLLGMSLNESENALQTLLNGLVTRKHNTFQNVQDALGTLLTTQSVTRKWIKQNHLDENIGIDWDEAYPTFFLIQPQFTREHPVLPTFLSVPNALELYSPQTIKAFIEYTFMVTQVEQPQRLRSHIPELMDLFAIFLKFVRENPEVGQQIDTRLMIGFINRAINEARDKNIPQQDAQIANARNILQQYLKPSTRRRIQWFDVKPERGHDLLS